MTAVTFGAHAPAPAQSAAHAPPPAAPAPSMVVSLGLTEGIPRVVPRHEGFVNSEALPSYTRELASLAGKKQKRGVTGN